MAIDLDRAYTIATDPVFRGRLEIILTRVASDKFVANSSPDNQKRLATRIANAPRDWASVFAPGVVGDMTNESQASNDEALESLVNSRFALHAGE